MSDQLIAYHEARARGGAACSIIEVGSVHPSSALTIDLWDDSLEPGYRKLMDRVRPHGMKIFHQIWHGGHQVLPRDGSPPWSASANPSVELGVVPIAMTKGMIDEVVEGYAKAAKRCADWGLDGVDIHCSHGYLPSQFLSANTNHREDDYGGSFENRARIVMEIAEAVRSAVPRDFVVGVRLAPDMTVNGVSAEDNLAVALMLEERDLIDYVNVSQGSYNAFPRIIGGMYEMAGYQLPLSTIITRAVKSPTMIIGRYRTLEECDQAIRSGDGDMVGLVRAMIADPDLVNKSLAGKVEQVRPCIACNQGCVGQVQSVFGHMECAVNAGTGHELEMGDHALKPATEVKTVLVVGGGPSGMEAARIAALRGHKVILCEASSSLGGQLVPASKGWTRHGLIDFVTWLEAEIYRLGVDVRLSTYLASDDVMEIGADAVIVATGSLPRMDGVQHSHPGQPLKGMERSNVLSSVDLLMGQHGDLGKSAVVVDDVGHYEGIAAAEHLIRAGLSVTYVTRLRQFAGHVQAPLMNEPFLQRMKDKPFEYLIRHRAIRIEDGKMLIGPSHFVDDESEARYIPADTVVFVSSNMPNREIFDVFTDRNTNIQVVGDANSPRFLQQAVKEGHLAGMAV